MILMRKVAGNGLGDTGILTRGHPYRHALSNVRAFRTTQNMEMTTNNPSIAKRPFLSDVMIVKEDRGGLHKCYTLPALANEFSLSFVIFFI